MTSGPRFDLAIAACAMALALLALGAQPCLAGPADKVEADKVKSALAEIQDEYRWKGAASPADFAADANPKFDRWGALLARLSSADQRAEADRICAAIVALWKHLGQDMLRAEAFIRDRFFVDEYRVDAAQFFQPVPFYPGDDKIMKLYRFSLYRGDQVVARYYLEHSQLDGKSENSYYVLTFTEPRTHQQVRPYGPELPTYWALKDAMLQHMAGRVRR